MNNITTSSKHIDWIDGLKGVSCLFIFFHHFFLQYYPASYYGNAQTSFLYGFDSLLASTPLGLIINGNFFVNLFIFISGYVITYQVITMKPDNFGVFLFKRYLKLLFPLFIYSIIIFITKIPSLINQSGFIKSIIKELYKTGDSLIFGILFKGDTYLGGHLWMMHCIFLGGLLAAILASLFWVTNNRKIIILPVIIGILLLVFFLPLPRKIHFSAVFLGSALCMLNKFYPVQIKKIFLYCLIIPGIFLGAFPSGLSPQNYYKFFLIPFDSGNGFSYCVWHCIAITILMFCFSYLSNIQTFFAKKTFLKLSKISFWIFLLHNIIITYTKPLFDLLQKHLINYNISVLLIFLTDLLLLILASSFFAIMISPLGNRLINGIMAKLLPTKE